MDDRPPFEVKVQEERRERRGASFFWPVILIAAGVAILLRNAGIIPDFDWGSLWRLWPVLLIMAGIDMLFGRRLPALGALFGLAVVAGAILLISWAPALGWTSPALPQINLPGFFESPGEIKTSYFDETMDGAESADIMLDLGPYRTQVQAGSDADVLMTAEIEHYYDMRFDISGGARRHITLDETNQSGFGARSAGDRYNWDIWLNPGLPIDLTVDMSSGRADFDLSELDIRDIEVECSSGDIDAELSASLEQLQYRGSSGDSYVSIAPETEARILIDMSSGRSVWALGDDCDLKIVVEDSSSGDLVFEVLDGMAIQLTVEDDSSGGVNVPRDMDRISGSGDDMEGVWETAGYSRAKRQIEITVEEMSSGDLIIRYLD